MVTAPSGINYVSQSASLSCAQSLRRLWGQERQAHLSHWVSLMVDEHVKSVLCRKPQLL